MYHFGLETNSVAREMIYGFQTLAALERYCRESRQPSNFHHHDHVFMLCFSLTWDDSCYYIISPGMSKRTNGPYGRKNRTPHDQVRRLHCFLQSISFRYDGGKLKTISPNSPLLVNVVLIVSTLEMMGDRRQLSPKNVYLCSLFTAFIHGGLAVLTSFHFLLSY
jgi:hypothetical protein